MQRGTYLHALVLSYCIFIAAATSLNGWCWPADLDTVNAQEIFTTPGLSEELRGELLRVWRRSLMDYEIFVLECKIHDKVRKEWQAKGTGQVFLKNLHSGTLRNMPGIPALCFN